MILLTLGDNHAKNAGNVLSFWWRYAARRWPLDVAATYARLQRIADNDNEFVDAQDMLAELSEDNKQLAANLRNAHSLCDQHGDVASASLIETWIDEAERRTWFLYEATR